ncbi:MAG: type IX secretion system membrane protein PorP/SprF [Bacteroidales bacterium]|nr:type IX secretion system membrane protein PorP/SprF [Bacteroidales bacterium]MBN2821034.1 type IX secretion system membrane protein PorP/SprF [Bacteroidales bacterium]
MKLFDIQYIVKNRYFVPYLFYSFMLLICVRGYSQISFTNRDFSLNPMLINPATCGADFLTKATITHTKQWTNINQAPVTTHASGQFRIGSFDFYNPKMFVNDSKFKSLERIGVGGGLYSNNYGPFREISFLLAYSYHIPITKNSNLSLGMSGVFNHYGVNNSDIKPRDPGDPLVDFESQLSANAGFGLFYYSKKYFAGVSSTKLFNTSIESTVENESPRNFYAVGGYRFFPAGNLFALEPSITYSRDFEESENYFDYNAKLYLVKYGWLRFSYYKDFEMKITVALRMYKSFYLAYTFANVNSELNSYTENTHGITIGKNLGVNRNTTNIY